MKRILVVDDECDLCEILRFNLEAEGFDVSVANSGEEALERMRGGEWGAEPDPFDLLLLDVMMDRMSGFDLARTLRGQGDATPIIFLTARDAHDDQLRGFDVGADDYITKPFSFDTVLARIRAVLRRSAQPEGDAVAGLGAKADLTKRERMILDLLCDNMGRYLGREEIMQAVWPDDAFVGERAVDVHIARLRKKLGEDGKRIINKTGYGYGLV